MEKSNVEVCSIRIMFPVESDEKAIEYKRKIEEVLADTPDTQIQFNISTMPQMPKR